MPITHINPPILQRHPTVSHGAYATGPGKLVCVGGQNAVNSYGEVIGQDLNSQTKQALTNVFAVLANVGADQSHVLKLGIYVVSGHDVSECVAAVQQMWGKHPVPMTVLQVAGLARPEFLVEMDALAFASETGRHA